MSVPAGPIYRVSDGAYPVGQSVFPPWYFNFLCDLARLPWPRIPQNAVHAMVKIAGERRKGSLRLRKAPSQ